MSLNAARLCEVHTSNTLSAPKTLILLLPKHIEHSTPVSFLRIGRRESREHGEIGSVSTWTESQFLACRIAYIVPKQIQGDPLGNPTE